MINELRERLDSLDYLIEEQDLDFERVDAETSKFRGRIVFSNGFVLEFTEYSSPDNHDYRFHLMDAENDLVRRWDNAPHHDVDTFPHHVHISEDAVEPHAEIGLLQVLDKVEELVLENS